MRIAALDLGSNSFHLLVVDAHPDGTFTTLAREKEMLHLGEVVARLGRLDEAHVDRAIDTVRRFATIAHGAGADEIHACATSALREAANSAEVVDLIESESGVRVRVISGRDEARLIFGAVRASVRIEHPPAVALDLGGGSLEVGVGDASGLLWSTSVKLGAARLTAEIVRADPPSPGDLRRLRSRIADVLRPVADDVVTFEPKTLIGTSGTFADVARMIEGARAGSVPTSVNQLTVHRRDVAALHERLVSMPAAARARVPGLDPRRAEQVPAGTLVLLTAMKLFGLNSCTIGEWALREGIVLDAIGHHDLSDWSRDPEAMRRASVLGLARRCGWDEAHARAVARLATDLFDQLLPLHHLSPGDRHLLEYAALLHDIGEHVAVESHHKHTAYLIEHGRLRGFAPDEISVLAVLGRFHRRSDPKSSFEPWAALGSERREQVLRLLAMLRLADGLDRGHSGQVDAVDVVVGEQRVQLVLHTAGDADLERWGLRRKQALFERVFGRRIETASADHPAMQARRR
ncbi:MAG TPA: Ppx/GppA phosphatase family protein [Acidimicrobiales bacterium]|nr:Ppx/GppA phosphatase family protein [Acidimicrobiales bacterium]